jgi:hypothetical protein
MSNAGNFNDLLRASRRRRFLVAPAPEAEQEPGAGFDYGAGPRAPIMPPANGNDQMRRWLLQRKEQLGTRTEHVVVPAERIR